MRGGREGGARLSFLLFAFLLAPFVVLGTANAAGYRYGASDLAFYGPAVMRHLDPELFPRDHPLIDAQARLTFMDETVGTIARLTTDNYPVLFFGLYLVTLILLAAGAALAGAVFYRHSTTTIALLAALTLRHAVAKTGTNTLEAYFHPRQLAFACGALAVAAFLRGRYPAAAAGLLGAALLHPTTTLWFGIWLTVAYVLSDRGWQRRLAIIAGSAALVAIWAFVRGPLAGRLTVMDAEWLGMLSSKDYLFPLQWPLAAWVLNLGYAAVIWLVYRWRRSAGVLVERERAVVLGCLALLPVFLIAAALSAARVALAIQLQPARVFWMLDFLATVYVVWAAAEGAAASRRRSLFAAAAITLLAIARGAWVMQVEFPDRPLFETSVPGDWGRTMAWARSQPAGTGWLADPNHAARYGSSIRMAAGRDVYVEAIKDGAIGMYDKTIAVRTRDRLEAVGDFASLSAERARELGSAASLDYLVTEQDLALPLAFQSGSLRVYRLQ